VDAVRGVDLQTPRSPRLDVFVDARRAIQPRRFAVFGQVDLDRLGRVQQLQVRRLILCSGKVYVDLMTSEHREKHSAIAIARIEQLYLFPVDDVKSVLDGYPNLEEVVWLQEEPENMGAWEFLQPHLTELTSRRWPLRYISRPRSSSPAEGSSAWHALNQKALIEQAYSLKSGAVVEKVTVERE